MSLAPPAYATTISYTHSYATTPLYDNVNAILVGVSEGSPTGSPTTNDYIIWDNLVERDQQAILDLVAQYGGTLPLAASVEAKDYVEFGTAIGADLTGLDSTTYYYATIYVDGVKYTEKWRGSAVNTYANLVSALNTWLTDVAVATLNSGIITIESAGSPVTTNNIVVQRGDDRNVFRRSVEFERWGTPLPSVTTTREIFERNQLPVNIARIQA